MDANIGLYKIPCIARYLLLENINMKDGCPIINGVIEEKG